VLGLVLSSIGGVVSGCVVTHVVGSVMELGV
jgi:hypothetical protein